MKDYRTEGDVGRTNARKKVHPLAAAAILLAIVGAAVLLVKSLPAPPAKPGSEKSGH